MGSAERVGFRPPLSSVLPTAAVLVGFGLIFPADGVWFFVVLGITATLLLRMRQLLVLGADDVEVTVLRTRRVPWSQIEGFESGSRMRGGTVIHTRGGQIWSVSPCSWWGGPADPQDVATLRRMLESRRRRR